MSKAADEFRFKIFAVDTWSMLEMFKKHDRFRAFRMTGLPNDAEVVAVQYDFYRNSILFKVASETFPVVIEGAELETFTVTIECFVYDEPPKPIAESKLEKPASKRRGYEFL